MDKQTQKDLKKYSDTNYTTLQQQIDAEYNIAYLHQFDKIQQSLARLKLYNNQKKDSDLVGDPLLFTVHQTILASLYDDELQVSFEGREQGDSDQASNLTDLAQYDFEKMQKSVSDYMWDWDALFFGRGLLLMMEFNRDKKVLAPVPENIDSMTFLRDPKAISVNGDLMGKGGMRFGGYELWLKRDNLKPEYGFFDTSYLRAENEIKSLLKQAEEARDSAQNLQFSWNRNEVESNLYENGVIPGLKWFTYWKGKRVMVILGSGRRRIIKYYELPIQDRYPIIDRPLFPTSHSWDGTSIPDLVEDKQRHKSVALNLAQNAMKADLYPQYLYDEDRIKNKGDLTNFGFNKFIGIQNNEGRDIAGAVRPMNKAQIHWETVSFIMNTLDTSAQKATATPDMQQGSLGQQNRTLGELNLVASKVDTRYSLTAKVFGWSEKEYWRQWYRMYKEFYAADIDKKVIRISGSLGSKWRPILRSDIVTDVDPDISIQSKNVSEQKNVRERVLMQGFGNALVLEPTANRRFFLKELAKLNGYKPDQIELLIPPTSEELKARDENNLLNENKLAQVTPTDDHMAHLEEHSKADETAAKAAHIAAHKLAMEIKRTRPDLFPQPVDQAGNPVPNPAQAGTAGGNMNNNIPTNVNPSSAVSDLMRSASSVG